MVIDGSFGPLRVRDDGPGWAYFWGEYAAERWEPHTLKLLRDMDWSGGRRVFVDIGAWIGPVSMWAARLGARVLAIEPDPVAYNALVSNVAANGLDDVTTLCAAIGSRSGLVRISTVTLGDSSSRVTEAGLLVAAFTLPDLLDLLDIPPSDVALVKIDVEGYEDRLMPALEPWLEEHAIPFALEPHAVRSGEAI